jgi:hypothetical protein
MADTPRVYTSSRSSLQLDSADPDDAKILAHQRKVARNMGRSGLDRDTIEPERDDLLQAYDEGAAADENQGGDQGDDLRGAFRDASGSLSRGSWSPTLSPPRRARDVGGLAFGLLLYTAAITYIRYGPAGWKGWLSAKFLNKPIQGLPGKGGPDTEVPA